MNAKSNVRPSVIARRYLERANDDALRALEAAITDALADLCEMERRTRRADRLISRRFVRGEGLTHRGEPE